MMGKSCCGRSEAQAASVATPRQVKLPDGTTITVTSAAEERAEKDKVWVRMRAAARQRGYTVK